jgi:hypothetical protein
MIQTGVMVIRIVYDFKTLKIDEKTQITEL